MTDSLIAVRNGTGWTNAAPNEVAQEFLTFARPGSTVLDVGAAFGVATLPALRTGARVIAVDSDFGHLSEISRAATGEPSSRLRLLHALFPEDTSLLDGSVHAALLSNVLHFLEGKRVDLALGKVKDWLEEGGTLHILVSTPYIAYLRAFIPDVERGIVEGQRWPGELRRVRDRCDPNVASQLPDFLHVFTGETLCRAVTEAGFDIDLCQTFRRIDIPPFAMLDGRENIRLKARKTSATRGAGSQEFSQPYLVSGSSVLADIRRLRQLAWTADGVGIPATSPILNDGHDDHASHYVVEDRAGRVVAAARICVHPRASDCPDARDLVALGSINERVASINRLVVDPAARGRGLSRLLDIARLRAAAALGSDIVAAVAGKQRVASLERLGFQVVAEVPQRVAVPLPAQLMIRRQGSSLQYLNNQ